MRTVIVTDFCGTVCITCVSRGWLFIKNCGCYRFRNWKATAVDCYENVSVQEVSVINFVHYVRSPKSQHCL